MSSHSAWGDLEPLLALADSLAGAYAGRAAASTSRGRERAILRLCGVGGLDRAGRPLAAEVVERHLDGPAGRLAAGVLLPFAMASLEYDMGPQELALEIAAGTVDLSLEAAGLHDPQKRAAAQHEALRLAASANARINDNRTARRELLGLLGESPMPWFGATVSELDVEAARGEALRLIDAGADVVRVNVPAGSELRARAQGRDGAGSAPGQRQPPDSRRTADGVPAGSQRGLAELRSAMDQAAAERRRYVRLITVGPALAAPELAVVAAFERIDAVEVDAIAEIVSEGVDPDRALADHAFAHRLLRRAGVQVVVGPGPLVVAPDLASGVPSDSGTRAGRALALQLLSVAFARQQGLPPDQILVGALPAWIGDERDPTIQAIAQVALRRALFAGHALVFDEPARSVPSEGWPFVFAAAVPGSEPTALVMRRAEAGRMRQVGEATRMAARVAAGVSLALGSRTLHGPALDHARSAVAAARALLQGLADRGWTAVVGASMDAPDRSRPGWDSVVERTDDFDPWSVEPSPAGSA